MVDLSKNKIQKKTKAATTARPRRTPNIEDLLCSEVFPSFFFWSNFCAILVVLNAKLKHAPLAQKT